jgi:hypothetical protein
MAFIIGINSTIPAENISGILSNATVPTSQLTGTFPTSQLTGTFPADRLTGFIRGSLISGYSDGLIVDGSNIEGTISGSRIDNIQGSQVINYGTGSGTYILMGSSLTGAAGFSATSDGNNAFRDAVKQVLTGTNNDTVGYGYSGGFGYAVSQALFYGFAGSYGTGSVFGSNVSIALQSGNVHYYGSSVNFGSEVKNCLLGSYASGYGTGSAFQIELGVAITGSEVQDGFKYNMTNLIESNQFEEGLHIDDQIVVIVSGKVGCIKVDDAKAYFNS